MTLWVCPDWAELEEAWSVEVEPEDSNNRKDQRNK